MASRFEQIDIVPEQIGHALKDKTLHVPPNQRDYSWQDKHVEDLYADFFFSIDKGAQEYFLGSIVIVRGNDGRDLVVDGQQRLATSLIFLAAVRDFLQESLKDSDGAKRFERRFIFTEEYLSKDDKPHLVLNDRDHPYFLPRVLLNPEDERRKAVMATKPKLDSHRKIDRAAKIAAKQVRAIAGATTREEHQAASLHKWVSFLENNARVIWVTVPDESSAYVIFETMNDRGLELSAADLIKNYLFGRANGDLEHVKYNWFRMVGTLDTIAETEVVKEYVRHFWISRNGVVRSQQLFDAIKRKVRASRTDAVNLVQELSETATNYVALATPSHALWNEYGEDARKAVDTLNTLGVVQVRPLLLAAIQNFDKGDVIQILKRAVSWSVRLLVAGTQGSGALETIYGDTAYGIHSKTLKSTNEVSAQMEKAVPKDEKFEQDFSEAHASKEKLARYYLRAMQRHLQNEKEPYFKPNDELGITLDHVMPENLSDDWRHINAEVHGDYLTRIGNLALLQAAVNSDLRSAGFGKKRAYLAEAGFTLTSDIAKYTEWNKNQIEDRQKILAKYAVATWPLRPK